MANPNEDCESHTHTQLRNQFVITRCWAGWLIHLMQMVFSCSLIHIKPALPITKSSFTLSVFECDWWQYGKFAFCEIRYGFECKWESCTAAGVCVCCAAAGAAASAWNNTLEWVFNYIVRTLRMIWFECVCVLYTIFSWECNAALVDHITHCIDVNVWRIRMQVNIF